MLNHQDSHKPQDRLLTPHMASFGLSGRHPHHPRRTTDGQLRRWKMWRSHWCDSGFPFCYCYNQGRAWSLASLVFRHLCMMMTLERSKTTEDLMGLVGLIVPFLLSFSMSSPTIAQIVAGPRSRGEQLSCLMVAHFYMRLKARPRSRAQTQNYQLCEIVQYITVATRLWQRSRLSSSGFCSSDC